MIVSVFRSGTLRLGARSKSSMTPRAAHPCESWDHEQDSTAQDLTDGVVSTVAPVPVQDPTGDEEGATADGCVDPLGEPFLRTRFALPTSPATFLRRERLA